MEHPAGCTANGQLVTVRAQRHTKPGTSGRLQATGTHPQHRLTRAVPGTNVPIIANQRTLGVL